MAPVARGPLRKALCFHTLQWKTHLNASWDESKTPPCLLQLVQTFNYFNVVTCVSKMEHVCIRFTSPATVIFATLFFVALVEPYENLSGNASSAVISYPCTKHISRACNPLPPNLRVTFNNYLASRKRITLLS